MLFRGKNSTFSYRPKSDWAAIYSRAPLHIQKLSLWLKDLYLYSIRLFGSDMSKVKVAFSSSEASKSKFKIFQNPPKSEKSDWAAIYSRAPLHIQKLSLWLKDLYLYSIRLFRSHMSKVKVAFSSSETSKSDQIHKKSETVNFLTRTSFTLESSYFG